MIPIPKVRKDKKTFFQLPPDIPTLLCLHTPRIKNQQEIDSIPEIKPSVDQYTFTVLVKATFTATA